VCPRESQGLRPIELAVRLRVHGVPSANAAAMSTARRRAPGRSSRWRCTSRTESRVPDVVPDPSRHGFSSRAPSRAQLLRRIRVEPHHLGEPRLAGVNEIELRVLTREVLVMQVQPVVPASFPDITSKSHTLSKVIPAYCSAIVTASSQGAALAARRRRPWAPSRAARVHVARFDLSSDGRDTGVVHRLEGHPASAASRRIAAHPAAGTIAAVVQQPLGLDAAWTTR